MRIGELSEVTGVPRRLLRYYEERGLIVPGRDPNGYRDYCDDAVDLVAQIRGLLAAGLTTDIIRDMLPCLDAPTDLHPPHIDAEMLARLHAQRDAMTSRIKCLTRNRDAIDAYLATAATAASD